MAAIGFKAHLHGRRFQFIHDEFSESCNKDLTVDSTLKHFANTKKDFKGLMSKIKHRVNLSQNACFKLVNAWSSRYNKQVKTHNC